MIRDDAEKLSTKITERLASDAPGCVAEVEAMSKRADWAAPGGAKPTFVRYKIRIRGEGRVARLDLDEAEALLGDMGDGWDADRLFRQLADRGHLVESLADQGPD